MVEKGEETEGDNKGSAEGPTEDGEDGGGSRSRRQRQRRQLLSMGL
jgi:hypothetical protein